MKIALLDLDGVLVDFLAGVRKTFNITKEELDKRHPPGEYWVEKALGLSLDDFWNEVDKEGDKWWSDLPWMEDGKEILRLVESNFNHVVIMTSPPMNPLAVSGKVAWIKNNIPKYIRRFSVTPCKEHFAHSNSVLIDDSDHGCSKFEQAGGHVILVPRRWNRLHEVSSSALVHLESSIRKYQSIPFHGGDV